MAVTFQLIRRPRTRKTPDEIRKELELSYRSIMWPAIKADLDAEVSGWRNKPTFKFYVRISGKQYIIEVRVDRRTRAGKIFVWVDKGTMGEGDPATTYPIEPVEAPFLVFDVPHQPVTLPTPPDTLHYDPMAEPKTLRSKHVDHPGIVPRRISRRVMMKYRNRKNRKGFYRVTENVYRRAFRRIKARRALRG